jgi:hypothetical protein
MMIYSLGFSLQPRTNFIDIDAKPETHIILAKLSHLNTPSCDLDRLCEEQLEATD